MRPGTFVAVVGPTGVGKDTLMSRAACHEALDQRVHFVRRTVTRIPLVESEDHDSLDEAAFAQADAEGAFAVSWAAHGLRYGLPRSVHADLATGLTLVANLSRHSLGDAAAAFAILHVVELTAPTDILLRRILSRGRESPDQIRDRLARQVHWTIPAGAAGHLRIDTSGTIDVAVDCFVEHLNMLCLGGSLPRGAQP